MSHSKRAFHPGDFVTTLGRCEIMERVVVEADNQAGVYLVSFVDGSDLKRVGRKEISKIFFAGDRVVDIIGRHGEVIGQRPGYNFAGVVFDEPSVKQLHHPHNYSKTTDGRFITCMEVNQLTKVSSHDTIDEKKIVFSDDEFLQLIGGV